MAAGEYRSVEPTHDLLLTSPQDYLTNLEGSKGSETIHAVGGSLHK